LAIDLLGRILRKNPVLTGRGRAGWYASMEGLGMPKVDLDTGLTLVHAWMKKVLDDKGWL